jgi:hypothetical protein
MCNFHRWVFETLRVCIWNIHLGNIYAYNMRIRSTPKRIVRMFQDLHDWWNYFFFTEGVFEEVRTAILFFQSVTFFYIFGMSQRLFLALQTNWKFSQCEPLRKHHICEYRQLRLVNDQMHYSIHLIPKM